MPNTRGLATATDLLTVMSPGERRAYGLHCTVEVPVAGDGISLIDNATSHTVASVGVNTAGTPIRVSAKVTLIDERLATPVNAFLKPFGKVKVNWRTEQREWKPLRKGSGAPRVAHPAPVKPHAATPRPATDEAVKITLGEALSKGVSTVEVVPEPTAEEAEAASLEATRVPATVSVIETERLFTGRPSQKPEVKALTKTYSMVGEVLLPTADATTLEDAWAAAAAGEPAAVLITGPAGTAKTRVAEQFAWSKGVGLVLVHGQDIQTAVDWYGGLVQRPDGRWEWEWSDIALAIIRGTPCVILLDELNRPENERALNGIMGLMDFTKTAKPTGVPHALRLPPGILIMATLNEGAEYVGTVQVDGAVRDRFGFGVRMDFSAESIESRILRQQAKGLDAETAKRLVRIAHGQRAKSDDSSVYPSGARISTRNLIVIARNIVRTGRDPKAAIWSNLRTRFWPEDEEHLTALIEGQFGSDVPDETAALPGDEELEHLLAGFGE